MLMLFLCVNRKIGDYMSEKCQNKVLNITRTARMPAFWDTPAASWLPILVIHIRSQVKTRQCKNYKFKKMIRDISGIFIQQGLKSYWERRRDESLIVATIRDDQWKMINIQQITPNLKRWDYSDIHDGGTWKYQRTYPHGWRWPPP